jgi:hypothetical protein
MPAFAGMTGRKSVPFHQSKVAPDAFTMAVHFGISALM